MKIRKIILGTAAFIVTAAGVFSFKMHRKYFGQRNLYAATKVGGNKCTLSTCTTAAGQPTFQPEPCHAVAVNHPTVFSGLDGTLWTARTSISNKKCLHAIRYWTKNN